MRPIPTITSPMGAWPSPKSRFIIGFPTWVIILNNGLINKHKSHINPSLVNHHNHKSHMDHYWASKFSLVNITLIFVDESPHRFFVFHQNFSGDLEHWWWRNYLLVNTTLFHFLVIELVKLHTIFFHFLVSFGDTKHFCWWNFFQHVFFFVETPPPLPVAKPWNHHCQS